MRISIKELKKLIKEVVEEGKYNSQTGRWEGDPEFGPMGWNSDSKLMDKLNVGGPKGKDPISSARMSSDPFADLDMGKDDYWGGEGVENDELRDDYLQTTGQGAHEQDPMLHGVEKSLPDPMYDGDEMDPEFQGMGWDKLAHGR